MSGQWLSTNPKAEQDAMDSKDKETKGSLNNICKRTRYIRDTYYKSYHLSGIVIDSLSTMLSSGVNGRATALK